MNLQIVNPMQGKGQNGEIKYALLCFPAITVFNQDQTAVNQFLSPPRSLSQMGCEEIKDVNSKNGEELKWSSQTTASDQCYDRTLRLHHTLAG